MFFPFTLKAKDTDLDQTQQLTCMCGKPVTLGDCLVCWTTAPHDKDPGWYASCSPQCIVHRVSMGNA